MRKLLLLTSALLITMPTYAAINDKYYKHVTGCMGEKVTMDLYKKKGSKSKYWAASTGKAGGFGGSNHKWRRKKVSYQDATAYLRRFIKKKMTGDPDYSYCLGLFGG